MVGNLTTPSFETALVSDVPVCSGLFTPPKPLIHFDLHRLGSFRSASTFPLFTLPAPFGAVYRRLQMESSPRGRGDRMLLTPNS